MIDNFNLYRFNLSKYQNDKFKDTESKILSSISRIKYCNKEDFSSKEENIIIISTSQSSPSQILKKIDKNKIKLWLHPNSGYDNLSYSFIEDSPFPIILGSEIRANAVFLYTIQCLLHSMGEVPFVKEWDSQRQFKRENSKQKKVLLIGHGHIGKKISVFLKTSNISYQISDPYQDIYPKPDFKFDTIILACSLNPENKFLLNESFFKKLNREVTIINPARGELIEEFSLLQQIEKFPLSKIYLDVYQEEPANFKRFNHFKNVFLSSHIAGVYTDIDDEIIHFEKKIIQDFLKLEFFIFLEKYKELNLKNRIQKGIKI